MKRTIIIASAALVALAACEERGGIERERTGLEEREPAPEPYQRPGEQAQREVEKEGEEGREKIGEVRKEGEERERVGGVGSDEKEPTAGRTGALGHLPEGCKAVSHADVAQLSNLPGAKEHLIPAFQEARRGNKNLQQTFALLKDAGIDSTKDVQSIALCVMDVPSGQEGTTSRMANSSAVVVMTGTFPKDELTSALEKRGGADMEKLDIGGVDVFHDKNRDLYVGQADDGAIIAASGRDNFEKAIEGGGEYALSADQAFGLLLPASTIENVLTRRGDPTAKRLAGKVERSTVTFDASTKELSLKVDMPDHTQAAELGGVMKAVQEQWRSNPPTEPQEKRIANNLDDASVSYDDDVVNLTVKVEDREIESLMKNLAEQVRSTI